MTLLLSSEVSSATERSSPLPRPPARTYHDAAVKFSCDRCGQRYFSVDEPADGQRYTLPCVVCGGLLLLEGGQFPALPTDGIDPKADPGRPRAPDATGAEPMVLALAVETRPDAPAAAAQPRRPAPEHPRVAATRRRSPMARPVGLVLATAVAGALVFAGAQRLLGQQRPATSSLDRAGPPAAREGQSGTPERTPTIVMGPSAIADAPAVAGPWRTIQERAIAAVAARRSQLEACVRESLKGAPRPPGLDARSVVLVLTVDPGGIVSRAAIDDPSIGNGATGTCVRAALSGLPFPTFEGEPVEVRVPLTLGGG